MWKQAEQIANSRAPRPALSSAIAAATGFFGGGIVSMIALSLAGLEVDVGSGKQALGITAILCGVIGYLAARSKETAHAKAFGEAMGEIEADWRTRQLPA